MSMLARQANIMTNIYHDRKQSFRCLSMDTNEPAGSNRAVAPS